MRVHGRPPPIAGREVAFDLRRAADLLEFVAEHRLPLPGG